MDIAFFRLLFDYNHWANERLLKSADRLSEAEYRQVVGAFSVRSKLTHLLGLQDIFLSRCQGVSPKNILSENNLLTFRDLLDRWHQHDVELEAFLASLTDERLEQPVTYRRLQGDEYTHPLGHMLMHIINHSTQTRSEAAVILTEFGHSPGDLDLIVYLRENVNVRL